MTTRTSAQDMVSAACAASLLGVRPAEVHRRIRAGGLVGVRSRSKASVKLPRWQLSHEMLAMLSALSEALGTSDGWALLQFLESPLGALGGLTPRSAIERGMAARVLAVAGYDDQSS